jgi:chromosome segregation ATPase
MENVKSEHAAVAETDVDEITVCSIAKQKTPQQTPSSKRRVYASARRKASKILKDLKTQDKSEVEHLKRRRRSLAATRKRINEIEAAFKDRRERIKDLTKTIKDSGVGEAVMKYFAEMETFLKEMRKTNKECVEKVDKAERQVSDLEHKLERTEQTFLEDTIGLFEGVNSTHMRRVALAAAAYAKRSAHN